MNYDVYFVNEKRRATLHDGQTLYQAQLEAGLQPDAPCGGNGSCGKCLVDVRNAGEMGWRRVRACETRPEVDVEVYTLNVQHDEMVLLSGKERTENSFRPMVQSARIRMESSGASDWDRMKTALDAAFGKRSWRYNPRLAAAVSTAIRTGAEMDVVVCGTWPIAAEMETRRHLMLALDIGTTSIAAYLLDGDAPKTLACGGAINSQRSFGADVVRRAEYAVKGGMDVLRDSVRTAVNKLIACLCAQAGVQKNEIYVVCAVGNSCMHHIFAGIVPDALLRAPYMPAVRETLTFSAAECGIKVHPNAMLYMPPLIAGFVGADTTVCLATAAWEKWKRPRLLIDIGTNGEIVMGDGRRRIACSAAAGPALEGAKISCGMRAADGAVDRAWVQKGEIRMHVIGNGEAKGVCGSGLIDLAASMRKCGMLRPDGRMVHTRAFPISESAAITQKDIRELQLAKGAICAAIRLSADALGIALEEIEQIDIAGAFGSSIDPDSAFAIGLLPIELRSVRINILGNAAGAGACLVLQDRDIGARLDTLARETDFLELASLPEFQNVFVRSLNFAEL